MKKTTSGFMKGMGAGMMVGMVAGAAGDMMMRGNKKALKNKASKAVQAVGNVMNDVGNLIK